MESNSIDTSTKRLFWEKYRPDSLESMVLLPRISNIVKHGVQTNMILTGPPGTGKSTLARILIKNHPHLKISSKLGVDILRNEVQTFCNTMSIDFDVKHTSNIKVVYLDEFDGASRQMQEELRAFIEEYEKHVRFIATCNDIHKIHTAILSRFNVIDFTPIGQQESKTLKIEFLKHLLHLNIKDNLGVDKNAIKELVIKNFPDFRKSLQDLQLIHLTGEAKIETFSSEDDQLYEMIFNSTSNEQVWDYLYTNWIDRLDLAFNKFNRTFWSWCEQNKPDKLQLLPNYYMIISKYIDSRLPNARDPFITLFAMICEIKNL